MGTIMQSLQVVILLLTMVAAFNTKFLLVETEKSGKDKAGVDKAGFAGYEVGQDYYNQMDYAYQTWGDDVTAYDGVCRVGNQRTQTAPTADQTTHLGNNIQTRQACLNLCRLSIGAKGCEYKGPTKKCASFTVKPRGPATSPGSMCWAFASPVEAPIQSAGDRHWTGGGDGSIVDTLGGGNI